jgi:hypothetical protein
MECNRSCAQAFGAYVLEALVVGDVEEEQHRLGAANVPRDHFGPEALAANVPNLQRNAAFAGQIDVRHVEVDADGLLVLSGKVIGDGAPRDARLSNGSVAQQNHLIVMLFCGSRSRARHAAAAALSAAIVRLQRRRRRRGSRR